MTAGPRPTTRTAHTPRGTMHRTATAAAALLLATLTACSTSNAHSSNTAAKPTPTPSKASPTYDEHDCRALLERNYDEDNVHDASGEPECAGLTHDEYIGVVKKVLLGRRDEILEDAEQEVVWGTAWEGTEPDQQELVCGRLLEDGPEIVGQEMADSSGDDADEKIAMAEYLLAEKC